MAARIIIISFWKIVIESVHHTLQKHGGLYNHLFYKDIGDNKVWVPIHKINARQDESDFSLIMGDGVIP